MSPFAGQVPHLLPRLHDTCTTAETGCMDPCRRLYSDSASCISQYWLKKIDSRAHRCHVLPNSRRGQVSATAGVLPVATASCCEAWMLPPGPRATNAVAQSHAGLPRISAIGSLACVFPSGCVPTFLPTERPKVKRVRMGPTSQAQSLYAAVSVNTE